MRLLSSSIFNSETVPVRTRALAESAAEADRALFVRPKRSAARRAAAGVGWTLFFLALFDVTANVLFRYPRDPLKAPSSLQQYFEYGRSIDGKLRRLVGPDAATTALVSYAGWLKGNPALTPPARVTPGKLGVRVYGMSFSDRVAYAAAALDPRLEVTTFDGPAAPPNHSFAGFMSEHEGRQLQADVVVLGILASSVPKLETMTMMTSTFEAPCVYSYPRYRVENGALTATWPLVQSLDELRAARNDPRAWEAWMRQLAANDVYYSSSVMGGGWASDWLDASALVRVARRAMAQKNTRDVTAKLHTAAGYRQDLVEILQKMISEFGRLSRADGRVPIVLLLNDQGYGADLFQAAEPVLAKEGIAYLSTHEIAPAGDHRNFAADSHFTDAANERIAKEFDIVLQRAVAGR